MKVKAIKDLSTLTDDKFFAEVSIGLSHILRNASRLIEDARLLDSQERFTSSRILFSVAKEEAAKFFILLDAVRCPRNPQDQFSRQLGRFQDHLAKGIYAEIYGLPYPNTFGEIVKIAKNERKSHYLDGPNGVDWIFRNQIFQAREEAMYVDYAEYNGSHAWIYPTKQDFSYEHEVEFLKIAQALDFLGCTSAASLKVIADCWRPVTMTLDYHWSTLNEMNFKMIEALSKRALLSNLSEDVLKFVGERWTFPLYSLETSEERIPLKELKEQQNNWSPE